MPVLASIVLPLMVENRRDVVILLVALRLDTVMEEFAVIVFVVMLLPAKVEAVNDNAVNTGTIKLPVTVKSMVVMEDPCILDAFNDDAVIEDI